MQAFTPFWGEGSPTRIDYGKTKYPYSIPSTGGPRPFGAMTLKLGEKNMGTPEGKIGQFAVGGFVSASLSSVLARSLERGRH